MALVHRPKYDDWSLPKGKLLHGEHELLGALREVHEETGCIAVPGRPLGTVSYLKGGLPKVVRYWAMRRLQGRFAATDEVDEMVWATPGEARSRLTYAHDQQLLDRSVEDHRPTRAAVIVRHASAGDRDSWPDDDRDRPLDQQGHAQAETVAAILDAYQTRRVFSADVRRCLQTVGPFASRHGVEIVSEPALSEEGAGQSPAAAVDRLLAAIRDPVPSAVCTQRAVLPCVQVAAERLGHRLDGPVSLHKGAMLVLHVTARGPLEIVAAETVET